MTGDTVTGKVTPDHLRRDAYLHVRQSTMAQVMHNTESTLRPYDLRGRAVALGWPADRVIVIDIDQGHSGASAADRAGFQLLVAEVSMGKAGIVLGLECSRLARNNADWHRLLEICALNQTLLCDADGLYDPCSFNDRMLLGMKGQLSEAELHLLRARMRGGLLAKASRGELAAQLPAGLVYDPAGKVVLDPDAGVRHAIGHLFTTFTATGSARAVVKAFADQHLTFPGRHRGGARSGELYWAPLKHFQVLKVLHNPRYAGVFCFGRQRHYTDAAGKHHSINKPREEWVALLPDAHPGYVTWQQFEANQARLADNAAAHGQDHTAGPAREGPALLQGLVVCGKCGRRMTVRYHTLAAGTIVPDYLCQADAVNNAVPICQSMPGAGIDTAVAALLLDTLTPLALEVALTVTDQLTSQAADADRIRATHVQRAHHAADQARRRYLAVDPTNRLVADTLEADWNNALRELAAAQDDYQRASNQASGPLTTTQRAKITALAADFPTLWNDPATPQRERKRLLRLLITDVTLLKTPTSITASVRMRGGQDHTLTLPRPLNHRQQRLTPASTLAVIEQLIGEHTYPQAAVILTEHGLTTGDGKPFTPDRVRYHCHFYKISGLRQRLRDAGMLTLNEMADQFGVHPFTVKRWHQLGLITGRQAEGRGTCLYHPGQTRPSPAAVTAADKATRSATGCPNPQPRPGNVGGVRHNDTGHTT